MDTYFLDSGVIITYYLIELGTNWTRRLVQNEQNICLVSDITLAEVAAALGQMQRAKHFGGKLRDETCARFREDLNGKLFLGHPVNEKTLELAAELALHRPLKGYDAVQVASALLIERESSIALVFVSGDNQMLRAAQAEGLTTDNPFDHESKTSDGE